MTPKDDEHRQTDTTVAAGPTGPAANTGPTAAGGPAVQDGPAPHRRHDGSFRWEQVELLAYKAEGSAPFRDVTRQVLIERPELGCQLRYFEVAPGGHSTLERHEHVHGVMVLRGRGACLVHDTVIELATNDLVTVPPLTWHQFRAGGDEPLGFLCMVNAERDRPILPTDEELAALRRDPVVAAFIRT